MRDKKVDVLHIHDLRVARAAWRVKAPGCKVVLDLHENRPEIMRLYKHVRLLTGRLTIFPRVWARFERRYIQASDVTIVVTQEAEAWYRGRGIVPQRGFWVVPNYAEKRFNPNPQVQSLDGAGVRMLYIGDTGERRGLGVALKAMRGMGPESNVELDVLGDGTYQSEIERMVRDWGLQDRVRPTVGWTLHIRCPFVPGGCGHLSHSAQSAPRHDVRQQDFPVRRMVFPSWSAIAPPKCRWSINTIVGPFTGRIRRRTLP